MATFKERESLLHPPEVTSSATMSSTMSEKDKTADAEVSCTPEIPGAETPTCVSSPMNTCLVLSLSFTFVYTAYLAIQNLQSSLNQEENLGVSSLSVLYGTIIICGTMAPTLIRLIGAKNVMLTAWLIHAIYTACNFYPTWGTLIPASALMGAIAAPMWTAQGIYITSAGESYAKMFFSAIPTSEALHAVLSKFNGIFFMFYEMTQITGNLISSFVLSSGSYNSTNSNEPKVCGVHVCDTADTGSNTSSSSEVEEPEKDVVYILLGVFLACNIVGFLVTAFFLPKLKNPEKDSNVTGGCSEMFGCMKMVVDSRMVLLIPLFMGQAMAVGVLYGDYTRDYISCGIGIQWVGYIMTSYGVCTAVFAISINSLARHMGRLSLFIIAVLADVSTLVAMLIWSPAGNEYVAVYFLIPAVSGISEGIMQAQFNTLVAQVFSDNMTPAFATYHTSKATSFTLTFVLSTFVCLRYRLFISIGLYGLGLVGYLITEFRLKRRATYTDKHGQTEVKKQSDIVDNTTKHNSGLQ
ncbi:protein unc-93 homolog A isoform X1 [Aplysia californica]|uniref:Protein unc-93 homolog A isoform X1 n=2 Tax=Aplysia californica TaxID=6500 RepID=A0ABM0JLN1_APLCA|nr:protein unc-93 homolog A isoform X1 [Aplysia californica]